MLVLLGLAGGVLLEEVGAGKTAEVEHLRHSVIVINSAVTTDESHKARKKKKRMSRRVMTYSRGRTYSQGSRIDSLTYEESHALLIPFANCWNGLRVSYLSNRDCQEQSFQLVGCEVAFRHNIATFHVTIFGTPKRAEREMLQGVLLDCAMERSQILLMSVPSGNVQNVKLP